MNQRPAVPIRPIGNNPSVIFSAAASIIKQSEEQNHKSTSQDSTRAVSTSSYAIVKFSLVNTEEFTACANGPVNKSVIDVMKSVKGIRYDNEKKRVIFPLESHDTLQVSLASLRIGVEPLIRSTIVAAQLTNMKKRDRGPVNDSESLLTGRIHNRLLDSLADFQKDGVVFILQNDGRALLADEMGLGKTRQAIAAAVMYKQDWPVLIICPSSAKYHWLHEFTNLTTPEVISTSQIHLIENQHYSYSSEHLVLIVSYNIVQKINYLLSNLNFNVIIADESHYLKNIKSQRSQSLIPLIKKSKRALLLSGTPALSRPMELFTQLHILAPSIWPDEKEFSKRYCKNSSKGKYTSDGRGASNTHELHVMLSNTVMIRRLKKDVMKLLPPKERIIIKLPIKDIKEHARLREMLDMIQLKERRSMMNAKRRRPSNDDCAGLKNDMLLVDEFSNIQTRKSYLLDLFSASGIAKIGSFLEHLDRFLNDLSSGKVLVFAHHRTVLDAIDQHLQSRLVEFIRIDGQTPSKDRYNKVNHFQKSPQCRVAVLAITAAGVAISLTSASTVFFTELFWTPGSLIQAEDRVHRIGQTAVVKIFYFLSDFTVDDIIWPMIKTKLRLLGEVVEGHQQDDILNDESDIFDILDESNDVEEVISEIVNDYEQCTEDSDEEEDSSDFLNVSSHSGSSSLIASRQNLNTVIPETSCHELDVFDELLGNDPLAEIYCNEILSAVEERDFGSTISYIPAFSRKLN